MHYGIIAAGLGSRLQQEGVARPKPLVLLNGVAMIERLIRVFVESEAESVSVIVNEEMNDVKEFLDELAARLSVPLNTIVKSTPSSMHSFYELSRVMRGKGRFILTTVDTIFRTESFKQYTRAFSDSSADVDSMMGITGYIEDEKPLYVATSASQSSYDEPNPIYDIYGFFDEPTANVQFISGGIYGLDESAIDLLEDCIESGVSRMRNFQRALIASGMNVKGYDLGKIVDVDHVGDIALAEHFLSEDNFSASSSIV
ncbi:MAG: NTP transferase domain-containing protein [Prevotella sp.]|nr:NTP transferase domain-containing protein [Bacteroides sp.]MCM1367092.1 NTP transferase domain-containing protein [Prevotella sp.]MCM1437357.1 NTP transferase domain-containing protein [Prevotella sp.]